MKRPAKPEAAPTDFDPAAICHDLIEAAGRLDMSVSDPGRLLHAASLFALVAVANRFCDVLSTQIAKDAKADPSAGEVASWALAITGVALWGLGAGIVIGTVIATCCALGRGLR